MVRYLQGVVTFVLILAVGSLSYGYYSLRDEVSDLKESAVRVDSQYAAQIVNTGSASSDVSVENNSPDSDTAYYYSDCIDCAEAIGNLIADSVRTVPTSSTITPTATSAKTPQTSYLQMGSISTSTSTDWYTIDDAVSQIDLANDFPSDAYVTFEASLKVLHGNGQAYARLWDDTHKIAVNGSEVSTVNNSDFQFVKSGRIYLWNGNNNYKVQIKSLNGYEVTYTNGRVKVVY